MPDDDARPSDPPDPDEPVGRASTSAVLFALTVLTVFLAGASYEGALTDAGSLMGVLRALPQGWKFAVPLLSILLVHELGHYFAARLHRVPASLPYFIPAPLISPLGTMGAVIAMPGRIRSRTALLDIGAAGPIAGFAVALPVICIGLATSKVEALDGPYIQEGQSLLYVGLKRLILGVIPAGSDVIMNGTAFAGWAGFLVTALNLIPVGQLDGGHVAHALFGPRQERIARVVHLCLLGMFALNFAHFAWVAKMGTTDALSNSSFYLVWFTLLAIMRRRGGAYHPETDPGELGPGRRAVAIGCLVLFALLFMPTPWAQYK